MDTSHLQRQAAFVRKSLFDQGYLDEQFIQLEELQDDANPNFVEEIVTLFYNDSARLIRNIELALENSPPDFARLDDSMHQFKGSSSSIGAKKVKKECTQFQEYCNAANAQGCIRAFQQVKQEHVILRRKLETYFQVTMTMSCFICCQYYFSSQDKPPNLQSFNQYLKADDEDKDKDTT